MTVTIRDMLEYVTGNRLPIFRATTQHIGGVYPFLSEVGLVHPDTGAKLLGPPVGYCGQERSGGVFCFDPATLYQAGIVQDVNVKIFGTVGNRKSTGVKCMIYRGVACGYNYLVTDLKGEYTRLAGAIPGSKILRFGTDTSLFINPLDESMDGDTQNELVGVLTISALGVRSELTVVEKALIWEAIANAHRSTPRTAILPDVVERLFNPTQEMARGMHRSIEELKSQGYEIALALQRLTEKDLRGMFHNETTPGLFRETPLLVLNCESLKGEAAALMITILNFFTQSQWGRADALHRFHGVIHDESWELAKYRAFAESLRRAFKLGGTWGVANYIVAHHPSDLAASGNAAIMESILADSSTTILYQQNEKLLRAYAEALNLNEAEMLRIINHRPGFATYKIGSLPGIEVEQVVWPEEWELVQTRDLLNGQAEMLTAV